MRKVLSVLGLCAVIGVGKCSAEIPTAPWLRSQKELNAARELVAPSHLGGKNHETKSRGPSGEELAKLKQGVAELRLEMDKLPKDKYGLPPADAEIYAAAVGKQIENNDWPMDLHVEAAFKTLEWGKAVVANLQADPDFIAHNMRGKSVLMGLRSPVDRSAQPYNIALPADFDPNSKKPYRLIVFLHGSLANGRMTTWLLESPSSGWGGDADSIQVRPFARGSNGYRWTYESDVWATIEDVKKRLPIDPNKIVLTGFSMGGGGTWDIGMLNPGAFATIAPMAGSSGAGPDIPNPTAVSSIKFAPLPEDEIQSRISRIASSSALATNGKGVRWILGCGGNDRLLSGQQAMARVFDEAEVAYTSFVVPGVAHTSGLVMASPEYRPFIQAFSRDPEPHEVYYSTAHLGHAERAWVRIEGMTAHYFLSSIHAVAAPDKGTLTIETGGVERFSIRPSEKQAPRGKTKLIVDKQAIDLSGMGQWEELLLARADENWELATKENKTMRKHPGLQGPIADAFARPFLCVRPTGTPWYQDNRKYVDALIAAVEARWSLNMQADLPIKDDVDVTAEDRQNYDLVLFGDPGSNLLMAECLAANDPALPLEWDPKTLRMGGETWDSANHLLSLIYPSAFQKDHYVVFNGAPMVRDRSRSSSSSAPATANSKSPLTVIPSALGDLAVLEVSQQENGEAGARTVFGGFFNEEWGLN